MELEYYRDVTTYTSVVRIQFTDEDIIRARSRMTSLDLICLVQWDNPESTIEEKLMALQLFARKLEEAENEKTSEVLDLRFEA